MRILELFSGTHSVGKVAKELGYEVLSLDMDGNADINIDILDWDYKQYPVGYFDVIWASPPCNTFSVLRRCWIGRKLKYFGDVIVTAEMLDNDMMQVGIPILRKTEEIINYFNPDLYFMENPKTGKMKDFVDRPFYDVDYCAYGFDYRKTTRIWTNKENFNNLRCSCVGRHKNNIGHSKTLTGVTPRQSLKERYSIPPKLIYDLLTTNL